ncbi:hypothetical protein ACH5Y9_05330 [Methylomonas sp. BW4-1]|uniref:hypothetical protein n=1 Tax=Methylomonas sp. BW4-1 TaxID=3376685 RepID=UPI004043491F
MANKEPKTIKIERSAEEIREELQIQLDKLDELSALYDQGKDHFAADIATVLRKLFRQKGNSKSLLGQLNNWNPSLFDTVETKKQGNPNIHIAPVSGMASVGVSQDGLKLYEVWKPAYQPSGTPFYTTFDTWWTKTLFHDTHGVAFSRKCLVDWLCDQDGGAHVDPALDQEYFRLTRESSYGFRQCLILGDAISNPDEPISPERIIEVERAKAGLLLVRAIVRQIAFEVQTSSSQLLPS